MPISTDGVLVGACAEVNGAQRVLDIGTGCGLIALMIAQRNHEATIDAIDIHEGAVAQASLNFSTSPWADRLCAAKADFLDFAQSTSARYDLIVSNPPFYTEDTLSPNCDRANARNASSLPLNLLIKNCESLLTGDGKLCIITPYKIKDTITEIVQSTSLHVNNCLIVKGNPEANPGRIIWHMSRANTPTRFSHLVIELARHSYTQEYINLTRDFYLKI